MRSNSAGLYLLVGILILVDLLGKTCGSLVNSGAGFCTGGILRASGLITGSDTVGSDGLLGGVMKEGDSGVVGSLGGSLNGRGGEAGGLSAGISCGTGVGIGLTTGCGRVGLIVGSQ